MKRRYRWLAVVVAFGLVVAALIALTALAGNGDKSRLQGTWVGEGGRRATFDRDIVDFGGIDRRCYYRLQPSASPSRIVLFSADAPGVNRPVTFLGIPLTRRSAGRLDMEYRSIYELRGDRLRICFPPAQPGADFPTGFDPVGGGLLLELHRE